MIHTIKSQTVTNLMRVRVIDPEEVERLEEERRRKQAEEQERLLSMHLAEGEDGGQQPLRREGDKIGRNADCPCGSGKKYKKCCGRFK